MVGSYLWPHAPMTMSFIEPIAHSNGNSGSAATVRSLDQQTFIGVSLRVDARPKTIYLPASTCTAVRLGRCRDRSAIDARPRQYYYLPHRQMLTWLSRANVRLVILPSNQVRVTWLQID
jgi:hypothetical protein